MRNLYLAILLLFTSLFCVAQTSQSDTIYRVDRSKIAAVIDEVSTEELLYFLPGDKDQKKIKIARGEVWKVVYVNGETEIFNLPGPLKTVNDKLFLKNGESFQVSIQEVTAEVVRFSLATNEQKQLPLTQVEKIVYVNGIEHSYAQEPEATPVQAETKAAAAAVSEKQEPALVTPQKPVAVPTAQPAPTSEPAAARPNEIIIKIQHEPAPENSGKEPRQEHKGYVGIRVGGSMTSFYTGKVAWPKKPFYNWEAGLGFSLASTKHYNARLELVYANKGSRETSSDQQPEITSRTKITYGQANLLPLILKAGGSKLNPAIGVGGYYAYRIKHVSEFKEADGEYEADDLTQDLIDHKFDYGALVMLAFYSGDRPLLEFRYEHGLAEVMKGLKVKNNGLSVSLFLKF
ncbi:outer membrane beta-barrel protein [Dyadobacter sp. CY323]|uniref:outer membrane beta-barrel protein n=1 Tax=Dyadobacter sp. CY323 TaxID=2907302 RepID=UPI001F216D6B|nr:outer membrane beta-barrel protein [Dyadobacter sp. CY323]MCE6991457.1 PorT family protein [Dyadobacter sp. CY323]